MKGLLAALLVVMAAGPAGAQVGHTPRESPYRDLEFPREWTFFTGSYDARRDPVGVAPRGGPMLGVRYDARIAGPAYVFGRVATAFTDRRVLDPRRANDQRFVGEDATPLLFADVNFGLSLTGFRTWHGFAPMVSGGIGFSGDLSGTNDVGGYRFGVPFTANLGAGVKWTTGGRWQLRLDWVTYLYQIRYPEQYYIDQGEGDPVLAEGDPRNLWRRNNAIQIGISFLTGGRR